MHDLGAATEDTTAGFTIAKLNEHRLTIALCGGLGDACGDARLADATLARDENKWAKGSVRAG